MTAGRPNVGGDVGPWRSMLEADLLAVHSLSMRSHPNHRERAEVLAEKFRLFPSGCFVLETKDGVVGYCFSHPWTRGAIPALDGFLGSLPAEPTTYYVHDLTLDESMRGVGRGRSVVPLLFEAAQYLGLSHLSLVAVTRRGLFWQAAGFAPSVDDALQATARAKYDAGAVHMERTL